MNDTVNKITSLLQCRLFADELSNVTVAKLNISFLLLQFYNLGSGTSKPGMILLSFLSNKNQTCKVHQKKIHTPSNFSILYLITDLTGTFITRKQKLKPERN